MGWGGPAQLELEGDRPLLLDPWRRRARWTDRHSGDTDAVKCVCICGFFWHFVSCASVVAHESKPRQRCAMLQAYCGRDHKQGQLLGVSGELAMDLLRVLELWLGAS